MKAIAYLLTWIGGIVMATIIIIFLVVLGSFIYEGWPVTGMALATGMLLIFVMLGFCWAKQYLKDHP